MFSFDKEREMDGNTSSILAEIKEVFSMSNTAKLITNYFFYPLNSFKNESNYDNFCKLYYEHA